MTNGEKLIEIFPNNRHISLKRTTQFVINPMTINQPMMVVDNDFWNAEYKESTTKIDYRRAFKIACDLLNGDVLYGIDTDDMYELMMKKDGVVSSSSYEEYILNHLQELDQGQYASETTTKNDLGVDCISRADVLQILLDYDYANENALVLKEIKALHPVTPQTRKGHWIGHREHCENLGVMPSGLGAYEWCSECDCGIDVREWHRNHYNYCPNCGARMVEPQESEG